MKTTFYASANLRRIYNDRVGDSMTQEQFAKRFKIGGQSMLNMILRGKKPLPIETAPKLAKALRCTIYDICPEMADYITDELLPALGKGLRRAAALLLCLFIPSLFVPPDAKAFTIKNIVATKRQAAESTSIIYIVYIRLFTFLNKLIFAHLNKLGEISLQTA